MKSNSSNGTEAARSNVEFRYYSTGPYIGDLCMVYMDDVRKFGRITEPADMPPPIAGHGMLSHPV